MGSLENLDPVMLDLFRAEMDAHLPALSQGLLALEKGRASSKDLEAMMRAAHSIKGAARIVGVDAAVRVSHVMEDCFLAAQGERLTLSSESVDVLLQGVDALQRICSPQTDSPMTEESIEALVAKIGEVRDGKSAAPAAPPVLKEPNVQAKPSADSLNETANAGAAQAAGELVASAAGSSEACVVLPKVFDTGAAETLRTEFSDILRRGPSLLCLDFAQVGQISAAALSLLASFARESSRREPAIAVVAEGLSGPMTILLRTTGLDRTFKPSSSRQSPPRR